MSHVTQGAPWPHLLICPCSSTTESVSSPFLLTERVLPWGPPGRPPNSLGPLQGGPALPPHRPHTLLIPINTVRGPCLQAEDCCVLPPAGNLERPLPVPVSLPPPALSALLHRAWVSLWAPAPSPQSLQDLLVELLSPRLLEIGLWHQVAAPLAPWHGDLQVHMGSWD